MIWDFSFSGDDGLQVGPRISILLKHGPVRLFLVCSLTVTKTSKSSMGMSTNRQAEEDEAAVQLLPRSETTPIVKEERKRDWLNPCELHLILKSK